MVRLERRLKKHREGGCGQNLLFFFFLLRIHNVEKCRRLLGAEKCFRLERKGVVKSEGTVGMWIRRSAPPRGRQSPVD